MESVRLRRLKSDHEVLRRLANRHPKIEIEGVSGNPPDRYRIKMRVRSLREKGEQIEVVDTHRLEITLPRGYPRDAPLFRMLTPVFHPNIAPHAVCIGDHWTASEQLDTLVQRVGEILAFQSYNIKSPLNGRAAQWVDENPTRLPLDREEFFVDLAAAEPQTNEAYRAATTCANCGATAGEMRTCPKGHTACGDCTLHCGQCGKSQCLTCGEHKNHVCPNAATACRNCGKAATGLVCNEWHTLCDDCGLACRTCGEVGCVVCGNIPCRTCATRAMAPA
jgi:ubiquitin-protein ligase